MNNCPYCGEAIHKDGRRFNCGTELHELKRSSGCRLLEKKNEETATIIKEKNQEIEWHKQHAKAAMDRLACLENKVKDFVFSVRQ